jgi:parallel beta-helix repeat protein
MKRKHPILYTILFLLLYIACPARQTTISLTNNLHITKSVTVKKGMYELQGIDSLNTGTIVIEGNNITIDFNGATLSGSNDIEHPDKFKGLAILIKGGKNITLKNAVIKGFKVAVMGRQTSNLKISNCDFSYNFRQHLNSNREREDVTDWQSYHRNEKDEWLRFGAGIYLRDCDSAVINNNIITNGQCALMMTNCNNGQVYNNNFSFNSGIGIGMYKSSRNHIMNNKVDWNVRGFSWGVYNRGQDSAGILVYEQSFNNVFANNSVTHSGDGFFLWAGQTTIDKGTGGCNDNLVYGNNFSYAPTNGIEITFSRNRIIRNIVNDCWHGIWGGFSYNTVIAKNYFSGNGSAIAIEHGQDNSIQQNTFQNDDIGIQLWFTPNRKGERGYMNSRDTRSRDYKISNNTFTGVKTVFDIKRSENILLENNKATGYKTLLKTDTAVKNLVVKNESEIINTEDDSTYIASVLPKIQLMNAMLPEQHRKGKKYIMMTEWGPYNFSYPILWLTKTDSTGKMFFDVIGNAGVWKIKKMQGVSQPSVTNGSVPAVITFQKNNSSIKDINIEMEYKGAAIIAPFGKKYKAGTPFNFSYKEFDMPMAWKVKWYAFDSTSDPIKQPAAFQHLLNSTPIKTAETKALNYVWWNGLGKGFPDSNLATVSTTAINIPKGMYQLSVSAGDIVKVFVDDKLVMDAWDISKKVYDADYHNDASIALGGKHIIRIEQAQYGGYGMLVFKLQKQ